MNEAQILEFCDRYEDQPNLSRETERLLDKRGFEQFITDCAEEGLQFIQSQSNVKALLDFLNRLGIPCSRKNAMLAYQYLSEQNMLEVAPVVTLTPAPINKRVSVKRVEQPLRLSHDCGLPGERQLAGERPERKQELLGHVIAKRMTEDAENRELAGEPTLHHPVSPEFRQKFIQSLSATQRRNRKTSEGLARAFASEMHPELDPIRDRFQFNRVVSELLADL